MVKVPRWYQWKDGVITPCYELPKKSGNGMKNYTLREARELKLLPSVTSVLSVIDKPELDNWRVEQAIKAALTLPRLPDEDADSFAQRVLADAEAQANKAAEFGTRIHDAIAVLLGQQIGNYKESIDEDLLPYLEHFDQWSEENIEEVHAVEKCIGHPSIGVAGRMDLDCTLKDMGRCVVDFKSQAIRDGEAKLWPDWLPQLSTYADCLTKEFGSPTWTVPRIMSIVIPSNEPGPVHARLWEREEQWSGSKVFNNALEIWIAFRGKGYDPRQQ